MKKFRINRKKWLRGKKEQNSRLYIKSENAGCCLGHIVRQHTHCAWNALDGLSMPWQFFKEKDSLGLSSKQIYGASLHNSSLASAAAYINDSLGYTDAVREEKLINLFKPHNILVEFYN